MQYVPWLVLIILLTSYTGVLAWATWTTIREVREINTRIAETKRRTGQILAETERMRSRRLGK